MLRQLFSLNLNQVSKPIKSSFGWHIVKLIDKKDRKEVKYEEVRDNFKNEILLDKGKEAVYDLQDELEDLLASGSTFEEISKILDVKLIVAKEIDREGNKIDKTNKEFQDERILRTIFNQKINEEGNIINIDKDEGLAISIVTEVIEPKQLEFSEAKTRVSEELKAKIRLEKAQKSFRYKKKVQGGKNFEQISKKYGLEIKGLSHLQEFYLIVVNYLFQ